MKADIAITDALLRRKGFDWICESIGAEENEAGIASQFIAIILGYAEPVQL